MRTTAAVVTSAALLAIGVSACGSSSHTTGSAPTSGGGAASTYHLLDITAMSGPLAVIGMPETQAVKGAVAFVNAHGGFSGHKVDLQVEDDQGDATTAVSILEQALTSGTKPDCVLPGVTSNETVALLPVLAKNGILSIASTGATQLSDPAKYPLSFGASFAANDSTDAEAHYLKQKGYTTIGLFHATDEFGTDWDSSIRQSLGEVGLTSVDVSYDPTSVDVSPELGRLEGDKPDVVLAEGFGAPVGSIFAARLKLGNFTIPFVADNTLSASDIWSTVNNPTALQNMVQETYAVGVDNPANTNRQSTTDLLAAVKPLGAIQAALSLYALDWDIVQTLKAGVAEAGSTSSTAMAAALLKLKSSDAEWAQNLGSGPGYTATNHFATAVPGNYVFVKSGPFVNGMVQSSS